MENPSNYDTDALLHDVGGCGRFQVLLAVISSTAWLPEAFTFLIMSFVVYNPGWKCLDNTTFFNGTDATTSTEWEKEDCELFDNCKNIQFNPDISTLVTEWGLTCNRGYILATIIALTHAGSLFANFFVGFVGDKYGRKVPLLISRFGVSALTLAAIYSVSWEMHAVVLFLLSFVGSFQMLIIVLVNEYVVSSWRVKMNGLPIGSMIAMTFSVCAMLTKDWKLLRWIGCVTGFASMLNIMWIPRSLRWLSVNGKNDAVFKIAKRIAKLNKAEMPKKHNIDLITKRNVEAKQKSTSNITMIHLFRPGYRITSVVVGFTNLSLYLIYFVIGFGIAALPGNFFINLIIYNASDFPSNALVFIFGDKYRRRPSTFMCFLLNSLCLFGIVVTYFTASGDLKRWVTLGLALSAKMFLLNTYTYLNTIRMEAYPTVARSTVTSYSSLMGSIGGIASPYFIPKTPSTIWVSYLALAIVGAIAAGSILFLPETKDKPLMDTWEPKVEQESNNTSKVV